MLQSHSSECRGSLEQEDSPGTDNVESPVLTGEHLQAVQGLLNAAICYFYFYNYQKKSHYLRLRQNLSYDVREKNATKFTVKYR